jgi:hypothetical protein
MFRPCILAIVRLYYKLNKQLYNTYRVCAWGSVGGTRSRTVVSGKPCHVQFTVQPDDGQYTGSKLVVIYPMYYSV